MPCLDAVSRIAPLVFALQIACAPQQPSVTRADSALGREAGIPDSALLFIRAASKEPLGALRPLDSLGNFLAARGVSIALRERDVNQTMTSLKARLGTAYLVLHTEQTFGIGEDSIGVVATNDQLEALRIRNTSGVNYDISSDSVIALYRGWHAAYGLELEGAGPDFLRARILRPPQDLLPFARAVFAACPDVVEQGTNTVEALADEMRRTGILFCWWD
jgi:hypothetical protein